MNGDQHYLGDREHMGDTEAKFSAPMLIEDLYRYCTYPRLSEAEVTTLEAAIGVLGRYAITQAEVEQIRNRRRR